MIKLPESLKTFEYSKGKCQDLYSKEQMLQFRLDTLEEAAKVSDATVCDTHIPTGVKIYGQRAGKAIRALLKDET